MTLRDFINKLLGRQPASANTDQAAAAAGARP